ncbi:MAG TPA: helix-turn-helix transcriptional regulator [Polyangiales bacterium]
MAKKAKRVPAMAAVEALVGKVTMGKLLWAIREGADQTQQAFAAKLGVSKAHLCDIEKGRRNVSPERAIKWAKLLGHSEQQFVKLALQSQLDANGIRFMVEIKAA